MQCISSRSSLTDILKKLNIQCIKPHFIQGYKNIESNDLSIQTSGIITVINRDDSHQGVLSYNWI